MSTNSLPVWPSVSVSSFEKISCGSCKKLNSVSLFWILHYIFVVWLLCFGSLPIQVFMSWICWVLYGSSRCIIDLKVSILTFFLTFHEQFPFRNSSVTSAFTHSSSLFYIRHFFKSGSFTFILLSSPFCTSGKCVFCPSTLVIVTAAQ